jgi:hypothetical protein
MYGRRAHRRNPPQESINRLTDDRGRASSAKDCFRPSRSEAALKFVAGKLPFAGMPRPIIRARREGQLLAGTSSSARHQAGDIEDGLQTALHGFKYSFTFPARDSLVIAGLSTSKSNNAVD